MKFRAAIKSRLMGKPMAPVSHCFIGELELDHDYKTCSESVGEGAYQQNDVWRECRVCGHQAPYEDGLDDYYDYVQ